MNAQGVLSRRWWATDGLVRLAQGLLLAWLVFAFAAQSNIGLADNGDYSRWMEVITSGPVGLDNWPPAGTPANHARFFYYWLPQWHLDWPLQQPRSAVTLLWLPGALLNAAVYSRTTLWLPLMGLPIKLALVALVVLVFVWIERRAPPPRRLLLTLALAGPLVLSLSTMDFVALINTFFREAGSLVFLLAFLASVVYLNARPSPARWWLCAGAAVLLTLAKASNVYWPLIAVPFLMGRTLTRFSWPAVAGRALAGAVLMAGLILFGLRAQADYTNGQTSYDNLFNSSLLVSQHPAEQLQQLGMPDALPCVGQSEFVPVGAACFTRYSSRMTPLNSLKVMLREPLVVVNQFKLGLDNLGDQSYEYQGLYSATDPRSALWPNIEGPFDQRFWGARSDQPLNFWSWLRFHLFPHGWPALACLALFAGLAALAYRRGGPGRDLAWVSLIAIAGCLLDIQVAVVGEGTQDLIKHLFLSNMLFDLAGLTAVAGLLCTVSLKGLLARNRPRPLAA